MCPLRPPAVHQSAAEMNGAGQMCWQMTSPLTGGGTGHFFLLVICPDEKAALGSHFESHNKGKYASRVARN